MGVMLGRPRYSCTGIFQWVALPGKREMLYFPFYPGWGKVFFFSPAEWQGEEGRGRSRMGRAPRDTALGTPQLSDLILFNGLCSLGD